MLTLTMKFSLFDDTSALQLTAHTDTAIQSVLQLTAHTDTAIQVFPSYYCSVSS
jgi:hypothetical protein